MDGTNGAGGRHQKQNLKNEIRIERMGTILGIGYWVGPPKYCPILGNTCPRILGGPKNPIFWPTLLVSSRGTKKHTWPTNLPYVICVLILFFSLTWVGTKIILRNRSIVYKNKFGRKNKPRRRKRTTKIIKRQIFERSGPLFVWHHKTKKNDDHAKSFCM